MNVSTDLRRLRDGRNAVRRAAIALALALACGASPAMAAPAAPGAAKAATVKWVESDPFDAGRPVTHRFEDVDGLPQNTIHSLLLDRAGYLWAGTQDGAAYYDGDIWNRVDLPNRERSNFIRSMLQTKNGDYWFGSQAGGLSRRRNGEWTVFEPGSSGLPDDRINVLLEVERADGGSDLWIGTHEGGLVRYDGTDWTVFSTAAGLPSPQVWDLLLVGEGAERRIWIATGAGPATLRLSDGAIELPPDAPRFSVSALLETVEPDGERVLRMGTYGAGLWSLSRGVWTQSRQEQGIPNLFLTDLEPSPSHGADAFWIATDGGGVLLYDDGKTRPLDLGATLSSRAAYHLLETSDQQGVRALWVGSRSNGVIRTVDGYWRGFQPFPETPNVPVNALLARLEANGEPALWLGTDGYGLAVRQGGAWKRLDVAAGAIGNNTVMTIFESRAVGRGARLWVGTRNGGLSEFDGAGWRRYDAEHGQLPHNLVQAVAESFDERGRGTLWVGTRTGLTTFDGSSWRRGRPVEGEPTNSVQSLLAVSSPGGPPEVWAGTNEGLYRVRQGIWSFWGPGEGLTNPTVHSLHMEGAISGRRTLWIGTGNGVQLLDPEDPNASTQTLAAAGFAGVPDGPVYSIQEDSERRFYLLTNHGITRLTRPAVVGSAPVIEQFTTEHGLPLNQGNPGAGFVDGRGRLWFGTVGGAVAFDPALEAADRVSDRLHLSAHPAVCADCPLFDGQELPHDRDRVVFRYNLLSYFAEPLTRFRTELVGHDVGPGDWTRGSVREVSALPSGKYLFRVWGRDAGGNVAGPAELAFAIRPAPWETPWALLLGSLAVGGLLFILLRARVAAHARRERALEEQVAARTRRLQQANALLVELSYLDAMTSVPNRRRFDEMFSEEWKRSQRAGAPLGVVVLDIDAFKSYNDSFGHQQGDEALKQVATALADGLSRSGDSIARYGGEEFAVLLPATDPAGATQVAEQLRRRVEALQIPHSPTSGRRVVTVSCGAVSITASLEIEPGELFRRADEAMYRAKRAGGNRTVTA